MDYQFQERSKFALMTVNVYTDLSTSVFQLCDGTWIMPGMPVPDIGWEKQLGSIRMERLGRANLVLFVEETSDNPEILDDVHQRLSGDLCLLFSMLHLRVGIDMKNADLLCGSSVNGVQEIWQVSQMPDFYQSQEYMPAPITQAWLEDGLVLRAGFAETDADKTQFRRIIRGLITLFKGLKEKSGQDRLHQFVRSLEALTYPEKSKTTKQFADRCQTFARSCGDTRALLLEAYSMRSDTEHLHAWDKSVQRFPADQRENVCWQRTRQIEHLACDAYSRLLRDPALRKHFRTEDTIAAFWELPDGQRLGLWGTPLDIAQEPFVQEYDQWGRASVN